MIRPAIPVRLGYRGMTSSPLQIAAIVAISLIGGFLGGLLGLGGSVFIIPALTFLLGSNQHLYQAAALITNVFVAAAASLRHRGRGTIRTDIIPSLLVASMVAALVGVGASNLVEPKPLAALFGLFLCYASVAEVLSLVMRREDPPPPPRGGQRIALGVSVGVAGGFASGLLGLGGGAVMIPILRRFGKLPVREAVATSATAMIAACAIGAVAKNAAVSGLRDSSGELLSVESSLLLALMMTPPAAIGAHIGATLVYRLPINSIRIVLAALLAIAGVRMIQSGGVDALDRLASMLRS